MNFKKNKVIKKLDTSLINCQENKNPFDRNKIKKDDIQINHQKKN